MGFSNESVACIGCSVLIGIFLIIYSVVLKNNFETDVDATTAFYQFPGNCTVLNSTLLQFTKRKKNLLLGCDNSYSFKVEFNPYEYVKVSDEKPPSGQWESKPWFAGLTKAKGDENNLLRCEETPLEVVRRKTPPIYSNGENVFCWVPKVKLSDNDRTLYECDGTKQNEVNPDCYKIFPPIRIMPVGITGECDVS